MKRLIGVVVAIIAVLTMTVPAMATTTEVEIGNGGAGNPPFVVCKFETPDQLDAAADGVNIKPESPIPPFTSPTTDGWKQVNFYVVVDDPDNDAFITGVDLRVLYPDLSEKFNLHVNRTGASTWSVDGGPGPESYPDNPTRSIYGETATPPADTVRELKFTPGAGGGTWDIVDTNADGVIGNDLDMTVPTFLTAYGTRVKYGPNPWIDGTDFTRDQVVALLEERDFDGTGKAIMLEIVSYIWFHQDPVVYTVDAVALAGEQSEVLRNTFQFVPQAALYLDFVNIDWQNLPSPASVLKEGDQVLGTTLLPTIWNNGNFGGQVSMAATKMLWDTNDNGQIDTEELGNASITGKFIQDFDVHLNYIVDGQTLQSGLACIRAGEASRLIRAVNPADPPGNPPDTRAPVYLPPCTPTQIDFSIFVPAGLMNGDYYGTITLTIANYVGTPPP